MSDLTVGRLRELIKDAPDDAPVRVNVVENGQDPFDLLTVSDGEVLKGEEWGDPAPTFVLLQAEV